MENYWMYLLFVLGVVLIVKDGAVWIAEVTRIPQFIIGATIVRLATTLPEIIISTIAALEGHSILIYINGAIRRSTLPVSLSYHGRFL